MSIVSDIVLPAALALIMFGMGLSLGVRDFTRFLNRPGPVAAALVSILLILPAAAFGVASIFNLPPVLAVGLILVGTCPGGTFSNLLTHYARGDLALSVTLTAIASFCVIFSMPLIVEFALAHFLGEEREIALPVLDAMQRIFLLTLCPVAVGMMLKKAKPAFAMAVADPVKNIAGVLIVAVFFYIIYEERETFALAIAQIALPVLVLNLLSVSVGTAIGFLSRSNVAERRAMTLEHTIKQEGLGIFIALTLLSRNEMVLPLMLNSLVGLFVGGAIAAVANLRKQETPYAV